MDTNMQNRIIENVVNTLAGRYARRSWWMDAEDLRQQGWIFALEASTQVDWNGKNPHSYLWTVVMRQLSDYVWSQSAPVSSGRGKRKRNLQGLHRADLSDSEDAMRVALGNPPTPHELVNEKRRVAKVRKAVEDIDPEALEVILGEKRSLSDPNRRRAYRKIASVRRDLETRKDLWEAYRDR